MSATNDFTLTPAQKRQRTMALNRQQAQSAGSAAPTRVRNASRAISNAENEGHVARNNARPSAAPNGSSARKRPAPAPAQGAPAPPPKRGRPPAAEARRSRAPNIGGQSTRAVPPRRSQPARSANPSRAPASTGPPSASTRRGLGGSQARPQLSHPRTQTVQPQQPSTAPTADINVNDSDGDDELIERPPRLRRPHPAVVDDEGHEDEEGDAMHYEDSAMDATMEEEPEEDSPVDEGDPIAEAAMFIDDGLAQEDEGRMPQPPPSAAQLFDSDVHPVQEEACRRSSKASQRRRDEMPQWTPEVIEVNDENDADTGEGAHGPSPVAWPGYSNIRNARHGRDLPVTQQSPEMRLLIDTAVDIASYNALFVDAIQEHQDGCDTDHYLHNVLVEAAGLFTDTHPAFLQRMTQEVDYTDPLRRVVMQRISTLRSTFKNLAAKSVDSWYNLPTQDAVECTAKVETLLHQSAFKFPEVPAGSPDGSRPYQHRAIIKLLSSIVFSSSSQSYVSKYHQYFRSSIESLPDEPELPIPTVALTATAINIALREYNSTSGRYNIVFNYEVYKHYYNVYVQDLEGFKRTQPTKFHRAMANLYHEASGRSGVIGPITVESETALYNVAAMPE
ncbi:hypothetical protein EV122DRAFT_275880 [Schizophyllum commune]